MGHLRLFASALLLTVLILSSGVALNLQLLESSPTGGGSSEFSNSSPDPGFPAYFQSPRLQKYYFTTYPSASAEFAALQAGSIDTLDFAVNVSLRSMVISDRRYQVNSSLGLFMWNVVFDAGRFPSNYTSYRQAVSLLIDRTDVVNNLPFGLGGKLPDQLSPGYPAIWHTSSPEGYDQNFALANSTLYSNGWRYTGGSTGQWYNIVNPSLKIDPTTTIFYARSDDPNRKYIGTQLSSTQHYTASTYHFDRLFQVDFVNRTIAFDVGYRAPECGYQSNNCLGTGYPAFMAFTQGLGNGFPDSGLFYSFFSTNFLDQSYGNFGHWVNATINADVNSLYFTTDTSMRDTLVRTVNHLITQQAWWDPIYYLQDWNPSTERTTGQLSGQNSLVPQPAWGYYNPYSFWRAHLKGRTFGGSLRMGISSPINQLNIFNVGNCCSGLELLQSVYDPLMYYDYDTGGFLPGLAYAITVTPLTNPILYNSKFGNPLTARWQTTSSPPYWSKNPGNASAYHQVPTGTRVDFTLYSNATWQDGSAITPNDIVWNIITDAINVDNANESPFATLDDVNITASSTVSLWFNSTSYEYALNSALTLMARPLPWIYRLNPWTSSKGDVGSISLSTKASLNLTAGALNLLDASGAYKIDPATSGDPFTVGSTFDLLANDNWVHHTTSKASYDTGIVLMSPYLPSSGLTGGSSLTVKVALVNGNNAKGLVWSGSVSDYVPDPSTVSDTTSGATVTARVFEGGSPSTLTYNPSSGLYEGSVTLPSTTGTYHLRIDASTVNSATSYSPTGSSQASASGSSWEGDSFHTQFTVGFPPTFSLHFFVNPTTGSLTFGGLTYASGQTDSYTGGSYPISAVAPSGYVFARWNTTGGISVSNPLAISATATVTGSGNLTANFGLPVVFASNAPGNVQSNAFVSTINYIPSTSNLTFTATGQKGTTGFTNVTVPKTIMPGTNQLKVYLNGTQVSSSNIVINQNSTHFSIYVTFVFHSGYFEKMTLCPPNTACVGPAPPSTLFAETLLLVSVLTIAIYPAVRKRQHANH